MDTITDRRSSTLSINAAKGIRPNELEYWDDGLEGENWRPVEGFESYFISDHARVVSIKHGVPKLLNLNSQSGYPRVCLCRDGAVFPYRVHRLLLLTFRGPQPPGHEAFHIDGNQRNNRLDNLLWEKTRQNNIRKREHRTGNKGKINGRAKLTENDVLEIRKLYSNGTKQLCIASEYGVMPQTISMIITGKNWKHI